METQVGIVGAGPAGLLLAALLHAAGIESVVLERRSRAYVEARVRAGVLEQGTVDLMDAVGAGARLHAHGLVHDGAAFVFDGVHHRVDFRELTGRSVTVYGQTEMTVDLIAGRAARGLPLVFEAEDVAIHGIEDTSGRGRPFLTWRGAGGECRLDCVFVAGCDGSHGISHTLVPPAIRRTYERVYPFGWLGILADVPPASHELIYAHHPRGFALASMRSPTRSRYYVQCAADEDPAAWPDERVWDELALRFGPDAAAGIVRGPSIEKSVTPLRSFVAEPMRHGRLFLAGDAAHIVPPTGAKGLNLAAADVHYLARAFAAWFRNGDAGPLDAYSATALARVWKAERFSWWLTSLMHRFHPPGSFEARMQAAEFDYLRSSRVASAALAENYVGLPF